MFGGYNKKISIWTNKILILFHLVIINQTVGYYYLFDNTY